MIEHIQIFAKQTVNWGPPLGHAKDDAAAVFVFVATTTTEIAFLIPVRINSIINNHHQTVHTHRCSLTYSLSLK